MMSPLRQLPLQLQQFMFGTWRQLPCGVMQKGKGKAAAASAASQPQLASQAMDTEDVPQLAQDIAFTSELLERFNAHADVWEALEVRQIERKTELEGSLKILDMRNAKGGTAWTQKLP